MIYSISVQIGDGRGVMMKAKHPCLLSAWFHTVQYFCLYSIFLSNDLLLDTTLKYVMYQRFSQCYLCVCVT